MQTIGVVGTGQMGAGIMQVSALAGYDVIGYANDAQSLEAGAKTIERMLKIATRKEGLDPDKAEAAKQRIRTTSDVTELAACDLVIEAIVEDLDVKRSVFAELDQVCQTEAILATNTSSLSVTKIAEATNRPGKVCGLHFFNPVPFMELVEVVRTDAVSDETLQAVREYARRIGKTAIDAKDIPGFIVNFTLMPLLLHAARMVEEGIASKEDIDKGMRLGAAHPKGPIELLDLIGIDTALKVAETICEAYPGKPQYEPPKIIRDLVAAGKLGKKSGEGFYSYRKP